MYHPYTIRTADTAPTLDEQMGNLPAASGGFADEQPADAFPPEPSMSDTELEAEYERHLADLAARRRAEGEALASLAAAEFGSDCIALGWALDTVLTLRVG